MAVVRGDSNVEQNDGTGPGRGGAGAGGVGRAADDDKALREQVLALNQITGDEPMRGEVLTLVEDKAKTPKLLAEAVKMAGEKDQPLNYNAAYMLARTAQMLKDADAAGPVSGVHRPGEEGEQPHQALRRLPRPHRRLLPRRQVRRRPEARREFLDLPQEKPAGADDLETPKYNATLRRAQD